MARTLKYEQFIKENSATDQYRRFDEEIRETERDITRLLELLSQAMDNALKEHADVLRYSAIARFKSDVLLNQGYTLKALDVLSVAEIKLEEFLLRYNLPEVSEKEVLLETSRVYFAVSRASRKLGSRASARQYRKFGGEVASSLLKQMNKAQLKEFALKGSTIKDKTTGLMLLVRACLRPPQKRHKRRDRGWRW